VFSAGLAFLFAGYAAVYTGIANLLNGGNGPTFAQSLGFQGGALAPPGADYPGRNAPATFSQGSNPNTGGGPRSFVQVPIPVPGLTTPPTVQVPI
jgi:hypothetical protein